MHNEGILEKVDFWKPGSHDLVTIGLTVDIHVPAAQLDMVFTILQQSGTEVKYLIIHTGFIRFSIALVSYDSKLMMWRKTQSRNSVNSCIGTDPNRNFDAGWCTTGATNNPCSETYCGSSVESEIESKNLANLICSNKSIIKSYLTIHSYSQLLLFPYSYKNDLAAHHSCVSQGAIAALHSLYGTRHTSGPGAVTIYPAAGGSGDWAYDLGVKYSYTFELSDEGRYGFLLPESQIKPTCEETMLAVKYIANHVLNNRLKHLIKA
ncbi:carboxypeptidase B-like [Carassius gibelio]|uniref:carboxypeptidase B-like n=1 Tax=Carassius gibelio TaxID=101364 RepID=UPI00227907F8|nr:carboxypeptidase B-like [Carassius gibelio]